jgi:protein-L-isoaspartate(D-aspartate) O-methyltransferase
LLIPLGRSEQHLVLVDRQGAFFRESRLDAVRFVPLQTGLE